MTNYASCRTTNISTRSRSIRIDFTKGGWRQFELLKNRGF